MRTCSIAVVGSGLAAIAACKSLIARGLFPVVLDVGSMIDADRLSVAERMSGAAPQQWRKADIDYLTANGTMHGGQFPKKLLFGSDYFYGRPEQASIDCQDWRADYPPFSFAKGGFSVGWGASVLPPDDCDLMDWPITSADLSRYYKIVLSTLPYSAVEDGLSENFPIISNPPSAVRLTRGNATLLKAMRDSRIMQPGQLVFGQARVLLNANQDDVAGCRYCGCCMSGCVYGSIYKSNQDLDSMISRKLIEYRAGLHVDRLEETTEGVRIYYHTPDGTSGTLVFDRVFLAAGALNSTAIVMRSKSYYDQVVEIKTTVGFVAPMLHWNKLPLDWPTANTMPGIFLEFKIENLLNHWSHVQLSTPNELVFEKLGIRHDDQGGMSYFKKIVASHMVIALCNLHSDHGNHYEITLKRSDKGVDRLVAKRQQSAQAKDALGKALSHLSRISRKFGCYLIRPLVQDTTGAHGYHLGGGLPMKHSPERELDTDRQGRPKGWQRIHVVDSSVFPSVPGTTVGLLAMANATRIASEFEF